MQGEWWRSNSYRVGADGRYDLAFAREDCPCSVAAPLAMSRNNRTHALTPPPAPSTPGKVEAAARAADADRGTRRESKGHTVELSATPRGRVMMHTRLCEYLRVAPRSRSRAQ